VIPRLWSVAVPVALLAGLVLGAGLGRPALYEPDEARHAEVAREMVETSSGWRDWVTLRHDEEPYRNKPAPFYWLVAAAYLAFGVGETSARLVSAVGGTVAAVVVALWGAARWGPRAGLLAGVVLLTAPQFVLLGRFSTLDMTMTLWITLGMFAADRFAERPGASLVPTAVAGAAGLLSKGLVAPGLIALVALATLAVRGRLRALRPRTLLVAGAVFLAITVPWHAVVAAIDPAYLHQLYVDQQWDRAVAAGRRLHARSALFYVPVLLGGFFPWSALLPATLRGTLWPERRDHATVFCGLWAATVLLVFGLAQGKVGSYVLPAFPPLALLTGRLLDIVLSGTATPTETRLVRAGSWIVAAVLLLAPPIAIAAAAMSYGGALLRPSLWALLLLPPAGVLAALLRRDRLRDAVIGVACTAAGFVLAFYQLAAPAFMEVRSDAAVARALREAAPDQAQVPLVGYHVASSSLAFYLKRPVLLHDRPGQLRRLLEQHGRLFVVTSQRHAAELEAAGPFVRVYATPRRILYVSRPAPPGPAAAP
jgi:4-amino-4-deoxy-L-arabinose transferase-like glycosyltransferase